MTQNYKLIRLVISKKKAVAKVGLIVKQEKSSIDQMQKKEVIQCHPQIISRQVVADNNLKGNSDSEKEKVLKVLKIEGIEAADILPPKTIRSCRKKAISYKEVSPSPPATQSKTVPCERTLFASANNDSIHIPSAVLPAAHDAEARDLDFISRRLESTRLENVPAVEGESDDSSLPLLFNPPASLGQGERPPRVSFAQESESPQFTKIEASGPPSSTDANSLSASPTIPATITPLLPRFPARAPPPPPPEEPTTPRSAIKQLRFQLPPSPPAGRGSSPPPAFEPKTPAGFTAVSPTPSRGRAVGCIQDDCSGLFRTARKESAPATPRAHSPGTPRATSPGLAPRVLFSPSPGPPPDEEDSGAGHADEGTGLAGRAFRRQRDALARGLLEELNEGVFGGRLPEDLEIRWSGAYTRTAGMTSFKLRYSPDEDAEGGVRVDHTASVELSNKVNLQTGMLSSV